MFVPGFVSNLELTWDWPPLGAFYRAFTSFARVTLFDKRGTGLSDRVRLMPTTDERMDDLRAVMDASACERAAVVGISEGAPLAISFAAAYPERVSALILYGPLPKATRTDDYPWAQPAEWWEEVALHFERAWGSPEYLEADVAWRAPSERDNEAFVRWWGIYRRLGASPGAAADLTRMNAQIDVRELLPQITVPTLVMARERDQVISVDHARYVADRIPGARYLELPGEDHLPFVGDADAVVNAIARMLGVHDVLSIDVAPVRSASRRVARARGRRSALCAGARGAVVGQPRQVEPRDRDGVVHLRVDGAEAPAERVQKARRRESHRSGGKAERHRRLAKDSRISP